MSAVRSMPLGPAFGPSRVIDFDSLDEEQQEQLMGFLCEHNVKFFDQCEDEKGNKTHAANIRMYEKAALEALQGNSPQSTQQTQKRRPNRSAADFAKNVESQLTGSMLFDFSCYPKFCSLITLRDSLRPKKRPLSWLMRLLEEIYDTRYVRDTADIKDSDLDDPLTLGRTSNIFPVFVVEFFSKRYGLRKLIDATCWDLLYNAHSLRKRLLSVEIFARFLEEYYDPDDLLFFLYVRSVVQKELGVSFRTRWSDLGKERQPREVYLSHKQCQQVARVVFGSESEPMYPTFMAMMERHMEDDPRATRNSDISFDGRRIEVTKFLHLALVEYHETRPADELDEDTLRSMGGNDQNSPAAIGSYVTGASVGFPGAGASGRGIVSSKEEQERLFREAEAEYEAKRRGDTRPAGRDQSPSTPANDRLGASQGSYGGGRSYMDSPGGSPPGLSASQLRGSSAGRPRPGEAHPAVLAGSQDVPVDSMARDAAAVQQLRDHLGAGPNSGYQAQTPQPSRGGPSASSSASGSRPSSRGGGRPTASRALLESLGEIMHEANEALLENLMTTARSLPAQVHSQIRKEVQTALEEKVDEMLSTIISGASGQVPRSTPTDVRQCVDQFVDMLEEDKTSAGAPPAHVRSFCDKVLACDQLRSEIEPLLALLVTYATSRLNGEQPAV